MEAAPDPAASPATRELLLWTSGDPTAAQRLLPHVYEELRRLAGGILRGKGADQTLQPTALVHEVFLRLIDQERIGARDRAHFRALAATAMRQVLSDHVRRKRTRKRGGDGVRSTLLEPPTPSEDEPVEFLLLDEVLTRLELLDPRQHRIVELRFFAGMEVDEVASAMDVSRSTVEREWRAARAWLGARIRERGAS